MTPPPDPDLIGELRESHAIALSVSARAREARQHRRPLALPFGASDATKREITSRISTEDRALSTLEGNPFFTRIRYTDDNRPSESLFTKTRGFVLLHGDNWMLLPWTSPLYVALKGAPVGSSRMLPSPSGQRSLVVELAHEFGRVLPKLLDIVVLGANRTHVLREFDTADGAHLGSIVLSPQQPAPARAYGLAEIIQLVDVDQRFVLAIPFSAHVVVEGPPGSGKTSIGLMRIPCLIDQQWEALKLSREAHVGYHRLETMLVSVAHDEMVPYLERLLGELEIAGVQVRSVSDLCKELCRKSNILSGKPVPASGALEHFKLSLDGVRAYFNGYVRHVEDTWSKARFDVERLAKGIPADLRFGSDLLAVWDGWVKRVRTKPNAGVDCNLAQPIGDWLYRALQEIEAFKERGEEVADVERAQGVLETLQEASRKLSNQIHTARDIVAAMRDTETGASHPIVEWKAQFALRAFTDADLALNAWLACRVLRARSAEGRVPVGFRRPSLTHLMVDEAQDLAPVHMALFRELLDPKGTITVVGDLRQRIAPGHFREWKELGLRESRTATLMTNNRQSAPLGRMVSRLHEVLFGVAPTWHPSTRPGPEPRLVLNLTGGIEPRIVDELTHWREEFEDGSFCVVLIGAPTEGRLNELRLALEEALSEMLVDVVLNDEQGAAHRAARSAGILLSSAAGVRGLEFDAVVVVSGPDDEIANAPMLREELFIATSRARTGLSCIGWPKVAGGAGFWRQGRPL